MTQSSPHFHAAMETMLPHGCSVSHFLLKHGELSMAITLYAQPYNIEARGFFFTDMDAYTQRQAACISSYGEPVEEFEIQFIDSDESIDCELFQALNVHQGTINAFLNVAETWDQHQKLKAILALIEGCSFKWEEENPDDLDVDVYVEMTMEDLARSFVEEGLFGEIPEKITYYLDYEAIARDLKMDYSETVIDGQKIVYRIG